MEKTQVDNIPPFVVHDGRLVTESTWWWYEHREKPSVKADGPKGLLMCKHRISLDCTCPRCVLVCCQVTIPGIGICGLRKSEHKSDSLGRLIHVRGPITWNGGIVIEVDDAALDDKNETPLKVAETSTERVTGHYCLPCDTTYYSGPCPTHSTWSQSMLREAEQHRAWDDE